MNYNPTIVEYFAEHERYRCGYCKSLDTNYSHGMWAHSMTCQDYQDLIDRGWRRSGKYCYKPTMNMTCCPMYTIKCKATEFQMSKSQKKAIKRVNRYLITGNKEDSETKNCTGGEEDEEDRGGEAVNEHGGVAMMLEKKVKPSGDVQLPVLKSKESDSQSGAGIERLTKKSSVPSEKSTQDTQRPLSSQENRPMSSQDKQPPKPGLGPDPTKPACKKAKQMRLEKRLSKKSIDGDSCQVKKPEKKKEAKTLEDFLSEPDHVQNCAHKLEIRLYRSSMEVQPFLLSFQESYSVYRKYQMAIHNDSPADCDKMCYRQFLIDSPLEEEHKEDGPACGYGSFHQHYLLDGKIIAVGVIDILPHCVSSVYLYYDPDYDFLGLGTYSALRELAFVRELHRTTPSIEFYYMGFYIQSCPKMRYKGKYTPSFLVCPETYSWIPIEKCRPLLEASRYSRLDKEGVEEKDKVEDISAVLVLFKNSVMPFDVYKTISKNKGSDQNEVFEYASFVGRQCAERMLLLRSK